MEILFALGAVGTLLWLAFWGLVLYAVWVFIRNSMPALKDIGPEDLSPLSLVLTFFLVLAVIFLFQQAWNDLGRVSGESARYFQDPEVQLGRLLIRALFVGPATILALVIFFMVKGKGTRYGVITLPYFIASLIFLIRLLFDTGRFVLEQYKTLGIYIVLIFMIAVISVLIYFVQKQYEAYKAQEVKVQKGVDVESKKEGGKRGDSLPSV